MAKRKNSQGKIYNSYFIPELCYLCELNDEAVKDSFFMRELNKHPKLGPIDRINKNNNFIRLLNDQEKHKHNLDKISAKEKNE